MKKKCKCIYNELYVLNMEKLVSMLERVWYMQRKMQFINAAGFYAAAKLVCSVMDRAHLKETKAFIRKNTELIVDKEKKYPYNRTGT